MNIRQLATKLVCILGNKKPNRKGTFYVLCCMQLQVVMDVATEESPKLKTLPMQWRQWGYCPTSSSTTASTSLTRSALSRLIQRWQGPNYLQLVVNLIIWLYDVDIEGHDVMILEDMKNTTLRPPIMWIEWYFSFKFVDEKIKLLEVTQCPEFSIISIRASYMKPLWGILEINMKQLWSKFP